MLSFTKYPEIDFTWFVSKGETTIEGWLQTVGNYGKEGMTTREIYDLRQQTNLFSVEDIGMILEKTMEDQALRPPDGKTAIVVDEVVKYGLSRMYEMQAEAEGAASNTQVFYQMDVAANWLGDDVAQCVSKQNAIPD